MTGLDKYRERKKEKCHEEESDEEEISVTVCRSLKMTEIEGVRKEFTRHQNESLVTWLLRCWDSWDGSLL